MAKRDRPTDASSTSGSSTSDESTRKRKRSEKKNKKNGKKQHSNSIAADDGEVAVDGYVKVNGTTATAAAQDALVPTNTFSTRRNSLGKAARDPRDEPSFKRRATEGLPPRQLTPVIDADGLSRAC
jgi:GTP cyclohydrolase I